MPRFERDARGSGPLVRGLTAQGFSVNGQVYRSVLLTPEQASGWDPPALADLGIEPLEPLLRLSPLPEFILLGTGANMAFPPRPLVEALEQRGVGVEAMDSRAAARTWGVLRAEDRWIAAALLPL